MAVSNSGRIGVSSKTNSIDMCYSNVSGIEILKNPKYCKGLAFSIEERQILGKSLEKLDWEIKWYSIIIVSHFCKILVSEYLLWKSKDSSVDGNIFFL